MSPAEKEARQMMADKKLMEASTRAYDRADKTPSSINESRPIADRVSRRLKQILSPAEEPNVDAMGNQTGMKKGGSVSSASKRADGIATKGKTRGKIC
jgi:hypothetical protein